MQRTQQREQYRCASQFLGPQLRAARERVGLKQSELARKLAVDPAMVSRWEFVASTRYAPVPPRHFERLASLLEVTLEELIPALSGADRLFHLVDALSLDETVTIGPEPLVPEPLCAHRPSQVTYTSSTCSSGEHPVPGRTVQQGEYFRTLLRCSTCRTTTVELSLQPGNLPSVCLGCGAQLRARVRLSVCHS